MDTARTDAMHPHGRTKLVLLCLMALDVLATLLLVRVSRAALGAASQAGADEVAILSTVLLWGGLALTWLVLLDLTRAAVAAARPSGRRPVAGRPPPGAPRVVAVLIGVGSTAATAAPAAASSISSTTVAGASLPVTPLPASYRAPAEAALEPVRSAPDPRWPATPSRESTGDITLLGLRPGPGEPGEVVVRRGECLWDIVARSLGPQASGAQIAAEWPRWYAANRARIGADPDLIHPGLRLRVPQGDAR